MSLLAWDGVFSMKIKQTTVLQRLLAKINKADPDFDNTIELLSEYLSTVVGMNRYLKWKKVCHKFINSKKESETYYVTDINVSPANVVLVPAYLLSTLTEDELISSVLGKLVGFEVTLRKENIDPALDPVQRLEDSDEKVYMVFLERKKV